MKNHFADFFKIDSEINQTTRFSLSIENFHSELSLPKLLTNPSELYQNSRKENGSGNSFMLIDTKEKAVSLIVSKEKADNRAKTLSAEGFFTIDLRVYFLEVKLASVLKNKGSSMQIPLSL